MEINACVAYLHWNACNTCQNFKNDGCIFDANELDFELHLGDFILCSEYYGTGEESN